MPGLKPGEKKRERKRRCPFFKRKEKRPLFSGGWGPQKRRGKEGPGRYPYAGKGGKKEVRKSIPRRGKKGLSLSFRKTRRAGKKGLDQLKVPPRREKEGQHDKPRPQEGGKKKKKVLFKLQGLGGKGPTNPSTAEGKKGGSWGRSE